MEVFEKEVDVRIREASRVLKLGSRTEKMEHNDSRQGTLKKMEDAKKIDKVDLL